MNSHQKIGKSPKKSIFEKIILKKWKIKINPREIQFANNTLVNLSTKFILHGLSHDMGLIHTISFRTN